MKNQAGVTLMELLVAVCIVGILSFWGFASYRQWQQQVMLVNSMEEVKSTLTYAQQLAVSAAQNNNWGVHFDTNNYTIFAGSYYDQANANNIVKKLNGTVILNPTSSFSDGASGYTADIVFTKFTGQTANIGTVTIAALSNPSINKSFNILAPGIIQ